MTEYREAAQKQSAYRRAVALLNSCDGVLDDAANVVRAQVADITDENVLSFWREVWRALPAAEKVVEGAAEQAAEREADRLAYAAKEAAAAAAEAANEARVRETYAAQNRKPVTANGAAAMVPAGHYAVDNREGELRFYEVDKPTEGRWAGYTFVSVLASDERHAVRNQMERSRILFAIAQDPQAAMLRYGKEIKRCGHCNRTLTNEKSRERGMGDICWGKMGW